MGQYCNMEFVTIDELGDRFTKVVHHRETEKWHECYDTALNGFDVQPMFPLRGQHPVDTPNTDDQLYGHGWLTLDEIINFDYSKPVLNLDGTVHTASWSEFLDDDGGFKEYFEEHLTMVKSFLREQKDVIVLFHFDS